MTLIDLNKHPNARKVFDTIKNVMVVTFVLSIATATLIGSIVFVNLLITILASPLLISLLIIFKAREKFFESKQNKFNASLQKSRDSNNTYTPTNDKATAENIEKAKNAMQASKKYFIKTLRIYLLLISLSFPLVGPLAILWLICRSQD